MTTLTNGYRGLSYILSLNSDRILSSGTIFGALMAGAYLASSL